MAREHALDSSRARSHPCIGPLLEHRENIWKTLDCKGRDSRHRSCSSKSSPSGFFPLPRGFSALDDFFAIINCIELNNERCFRKLFGSSALKGKRNIRKLFVDGKFINSWFIGRKPEFKMKSNIQFTKKLYLILLTNKYQTKLSTTHIYLPIVTILIYM